VSVVPLVLGAVGGLVVGAVLGLWLGDRLKASTAKLLVGVGVLFVACTWAATAGLQSSNPWVVGAAVGALAGGLTGMKYGRDSELRRLISPRGR
jgi:hypothetical protein